MCSCQTLAGNCGCETLGDYNPAGRRLLDGWEVAAFMARHPVVATQIAETNAFILAGFYDWSYNPATQWRFPGVIPPWGMQVEDSQFGTVTLQVGTDGTWYYSIGRDASPDLGTDNPDYVSDSGNTFEALADDFKRAMGTLGGFALAGIAVYAILSRKR